MREQLRPWLDRAVITTGTVARFRHNPHSSEQWHEH